MYSKSRGKNVVAPPKIGPVTLALQLLSGDRLVGEFQPQVSLWDILQHWEGNKQLNPSLESLKALASEAPACIYLRKEVATEEALKATTLLDLGIMNGKAAIRYATKSEGPKEQAHVGGVLLPPPKPVTVPSPLPDVPIAPSVPEPLIADEPVELQSAEPDVVEMEVEPPASEPEKDTKSVQEMIQEAPPAQQIDLVVHLLNERGDLIYLRPESVEHFIRSDQEPDDAFFELTDEEIRKMMHDLSQQTRRLENAPLVTAQIRQAQEEERKQQLLSKYPTTLLRIQFADGLILQMPLPSTTCLDQVKKELLNYLQDVTDVGGYELYVTPPKEVLKTDVSLYDLGLTPSSLIYISSNCSIKEQFRQSVSNYAGAVSQASLRLHSSSRPSSALNVDTNDTHRSKRSAPSTSSSSSTAGNQQVPKWLKMNR